MKKLALAIAAPLLAGACNDTQIVVGGLHEVTSMRAIPNQDLDILFVIDNSPSMADDQQALADNFPRMMDVLSELPGGLPNLHIGVVTSDMGSSGGPMIGNGPGSCVGNGDGGALVAPFLSDIATASGRERNYDGDLRTAFTQMALVGEQGCGFEQHLGAMRAALTNPANAGFLRPEANLAVVIVGDEDDCTANAGLFDPDTTTLGPLQSFRCFEFGVLCSPDDPRTPGAKTGCVPRSSTFMEDVQPFVTALYATKPDQRMIMAAGITGPIDPVEVEFDPNTSSTRLTPTCAHAGLATATPSIRLSAFLDAFAPRSTMTSICESDFSAPLVQIGETAKRLVGDPCIDTTGLLDSLPEVDGVQPACKVLDVRDSRPDAPTTLPECSSSGGDCYSLKVDLAACPRTPGNLALHIERSHAVSDDTWVHVQCQSE